MEGTVNEEARDVIGRDIDRLDNLHHATKLPMPPSFHLQQLQAQLPELIEDMKDHFADAFGCDPWELHPGRRKRGAR
jgi:hypothetical protein